MSRLLVIFRLGVKELWSLARDPILLALIVYTFSASIYVAATARPETLHKVPIAIVDEDASPLSARIAAAFFPPQFAPPPIVDARAADRGLDDGDYTFSLDIPPDFQRDVLAGRHATVQLNVDATRMTQAFTGGGYIQQIVSGEIDAFVRRHRGAALPPVDLAMRMRFNPNLDEVWFGALMELINNVTMLSMILTGAALIREREHGTIEHLLVMPVTAAEIMLAKVWSMGRRPSRRSRSSWAARCTCRFPVPCRCSWPAWRCTCSRPRRWGSFSRRSCAACRSSACCSSSCCCRCNFCRAG